MATYNVEGSFEPTTGDGNPSHMVNTGDSGDQTRFDTGFVSQDSPLREGNTSRSDEDRVETNELMDTTFVHIANSSDPPLGPVNTGRSGEDNIEQIKELTELCTTLATRCTNLESQVQTLQTVTTSQDQLIHHLKFQVRCLGALSRSRTSHSKRLKRKVKKQVIGSPKVAASLGEDASKQGRNEAKDSGEAIGLSTSAGLDNVADMENDGDMCDVIASGEDMVQEEMDLDSGDNENFVVADRE